MSRSFIVVGLLLVGVLASPASGVVVCPATSISVTVATNGGVQASMTGDWSGAKTFSFCSLETTQHAVGPATCKAILSSLVTAQSEDVELKLVLNNNFSGSTCADVSTVYPANSWVPFSNVGASVIVTDQPNP